MWFTRSQRDRREGEVAPTIGALVLIGEEGGMAPHAVHVHADLEHVASHTRSGFWSEGRWQFEFVKSDGSQVDSADRDWMRVTDPLTSSLVYTDSRYSASPTCAFVFRSPGSYKIRARYQNRDKIWSSWTESGTIVVASNTRTKIYVNGTTGNDSNDGLSAGNAKLTLRGALLLVNSNDFEIIIADDTTCNTGVGQVNLTSRSGIWIHRSGTGSAKPKVILEEDGSVVLGSHSSIEGLELEYNGVETHIFAVYGDDAQNISCIDTEFNEISSFFEIATNTNPVGLLLLRCLQKERVDRYCLYVGEFESVVIMGCTFVGGSTSEHTVRLFTDPTFGISKYASVEYSHLDYQGGSGRNKSALRAYLHYLGVYRCKIFGGSLSLGNIDLKTGAEDEYFEYCIDQIWFDGSAPTSTTSGMTIWEDVSNIVVRSSLFTKIGSTSNFLFSASDRASGGAGSISDVKILNCTFKRVGTAQYGTAELGETCSIERFAFNGCLFIHDETEYTWGHRIGAISPISFTDCVHTPSLPSDGYEFTYDGVNYRNTTLANAEDWASGLIEEDHDIGDLGEPSGVGTNWKTAVQSMVGVFESLNGQAWTSAGPAGCWREP